jgi:hypothetical protein
MVAINALRNVGKLLPHYADVTFQEGGKIAIFFTNGK